MTSRMTISLEKSFSLDIMIKRPFSFITICAALYRLGKGHFKCAERILALFFATYAANGFAKTYLHAYNIGRR
jgi:hypothetical protein